MSLLAALKLPAATASRPATPAASPPGGNTAGRSGNGKDRGHDEFDREADRLREAYAARLKVAVQVAGQLDAPGKKALAEALAAADKQRAAADRLTDPASRLQALRASQQRIDDALTSADPGGGRAVRVEAASLLPKLEPKLKAAEAAVRSAQADADKAEVDAKTAKALKLADKAEVEARKGAADKRLAAAQRELKQLDADVTALRNASTGDAALHDVIARQGGAGSAAVGAKGEYAAAEAAGLQRGTQSTTTSTVVGDRSTTTSNTTSRTVGRDGVTDVTSNERTTQQGDRKTTVSDQRATTIGPDGAKVETTRKVENAKGDKTGSIETKTSTAGSLSAGTVTHGKTTTVTRADGTSTATATSGGVERADGKLGGNVGRSTTQTDAKGKETKSGMTGKGGLVAGPEGIGGYGDVERGRETKGPGGMTTGLVAGLSANILCNVAKDDSVDPPMYDVTLTVDLGARVGGSVGHDKEPDKGKPDDATRGSGKASAGGSVKVSLERKHRFDEAGARAYAEALKTGNGTDVEFAVIKVGLGKGWAQARDYYLGLTGQLASKDAEDRLEKGGSVKVGAERKGNVGGEIGTKGGALGGSISAGYEGSHDGSLALSKDKDGKVAYDAKQNDSDKLSGGVKVNAGGVEGSFSAGRTWSTSTGYKIAIPATAGAAEADAMRKALNACKSQQDLDAFAKQYPQAVEESTKGSGVKDAQEIGVGVGSAKATMKFGTANDQQTTLDKDGKVKEKKSTGSSEGGMDVTLLGRKVGASSKQQATATTDAEGRTRAELSQSDTETDTAKLLGTLPGSGEGGLLAKATGGSDTDRKTLSGYGLDEATLLALGQRARGDWKRWMNAAVNPDDRTAWAAAGNAIRAVKEPDGDKEHRALTGAVATALAAFVGGSSRQRLQVIYDAVRGKAGVGGGSGWEFPGALASLKGDYDASVIAASEQSVADLAKQPAEAKKRADALTATLDKLYAAVDREPGFSNPALRGEMLAAINARKAKVRAALRAAGGGGGDDAAAQQEERKARYNELIRNVLNFQQDEKKLFEQVQANLEATFANHSAAENVKPLAQLDALYAVWDPQYEELATLVQVHGIGNKASFDSYRPDRKRYQLAHDNKKPYGERGKNETEKEQAKRYERLEGKDQKDRLAASKEKPIEDVRAERAAADAKRVADGTRIQNELPGVAKRCWARGQMLDSFLTAERKAAAAKLYQDGSQLYNDAEDLAAKVHRDHMPELVDLGAKALAKYKQALALFDKGIAQYPKDWSK